VATSERRHFDTLFSSTRTNDRYATIPDQTQPLLATYGTVFRARSLPVGWGLRGVPDSSNNHI